MPGEAAVTIGAEQWQVGLATTTAELHAGLGGLPSIPVSTGMLFDVGMTWIIQVTTVPMLFPLDIVFIGSDLKVVGVSLNVAPGLLVQSGSPARFFLEVNAGEAVGITAGDGVSIMQTSGSPLDFQPASSELIGQFIQMFMTLAMLMLVFKMIGPMMRLGEKVTEKVIPAPKKKVEPSEAAVKALKSAEKNFRKNVDLPGGFADDLRAGLTSSWNFNLQIYPDLPYQLFAVREGDIEQVLGVQGDVYDWLILDTYKGILLVRVKSRMMMQRVPRPRSERDWERLAERIVTSPGFSPEQAEVVGGLLADITAPIPSWPLESKHKAVDLKYAAERRLLQMAADAGIDIGRMQAQKLTPGSEQARGLLRPGRFPERDKALMGLGPHNIVEVHDDGDLTVESRGVLYVVTTEGQLFEQTPLPSKWTATEAWLYHGVAYGSQGEVLEDHDFDYPPGLGLARAWAEVLEHKGKHVDRIVFSGPEGYKRAYTRRYLYGQTTPSGLVFADTSASISASTARITHYPLLEEAFKSAIARTGGKV